MYHKCKLLRHFRIPGDPFTSVKSCRPYPSALRFVILKRKREGDTVTLSLFLRKTGPILTPSARFRMSTGHSHKPLTTPVKQFHCFSSFRLGHIGIHSGSNCACTNCRGKDMEKLQFNLDPWNWPGSGSCTVRLRYGLIKTADHLQPVRRFLHLRTRVRCLPPRLGLWNSCSLYLRLLR